jgi:hypothetical protein
VNEVQLTVPPLGGAGHTAPDEQLKITPPQSNPDGQSASVSQSCPQKLPVWPSVTKVRHETVGAHSAPGMQLLQSSRLGRVAQVPVMRLQN